jgi:hypothetical protein
VSGVFAHHRSDRCSTRSEIEKVSGVFFSSSPWAGIRHVQRMKPRTEGIAMERISPTPLFSFPPQATRS